MSLIIEHRYFYSVRFSYTSAIAALRFNKAIKTKKITKSFFKDNEAMCIRILFNALHHCALATDGYRIEDELLKKFRNALEASNAEVVDIIGRGRAWMNETQTARELTRNDVLLLKKMAKICEVISDDHFEAARRRENEEERQTNAYMSRE